MERRTAIKIVALSAFSATVSPSSDAAFLWSPDAYQLRFFTQAENQLLDQLMEIIIPADAHSPGAHAAKVSLFADWMVSTSHEAVQAKWRENLRAFRQAAAHSSPVDALAEAASHESRPRTALDHFFVDLKQMTVNGYYTSAIGIHQDLQYQGNTYLAAFPGCTKKVVRSQA
ncbi:MAG TPA: gluconate 2-dehydrogenase subunit 3 family protein [Terriglobia bacterium]|nr:gluconate 2-dehydrogenase subunit 3 family protein [Terriglobia bacterium]